MTDERGWLLVYFAHHQGRDESEPRYPAMDYMRGVYDESCWSATLSILAEMPLPRLRNRMTRVDGAGVCYR